MESQNEELQQLTQSWDAEKKRLDEGKAAKEQLEEAQRELREAERNGDFARAGELMHSILPDLRKKVGRWMRRMMRVCFARPVIG